MALIEMVMPKMGESIMEGTVLTWLKKLGERIEQDEAVLEVATDKVDTEVPATHAGWLTQILATEGQIIAVGTPIAIIDTQQPASTAAQTSQIEPPPMPASPAPIIFEQQPNALADMPQMPQIQPFVQPSPAHAEPQTQSLHTQTTAHNQAGFLMEQPEPGRFYSPLVLTIAREEKVSMMDLERIPGTGQDNRVTKKDILDFVAWHTGGGNTAEQTPTPSTPAPAAPLQTLPPVVPAPPFVPVVAEHSSLIHQTSTPKTASERAIQAQNAPTSPALPTTDFQTLISNQADQPIQNVGFETKTDINVGSDPISNVPALPGDNVPAADPKPIGKASPKTGHADTEIIEMDRMRKIIAQRMVESKRIAPHVTSFVEADVTGIVFWRNRIKNDFLQKEGDVITYTPIFLEAVAKAIKDYPMINVSVDNDKIIVKRDINIGMAVALPSGNLIVPVIRNADQLNIVGLTRKVNDLARRARENKLVADDLAGGTYTISNVGSFGNLMGTPIILQPQVGILALGAIQKKPSVIETAQGDSIAIRHKMFLSHSYDHRVVDGALGGMFVRRVADYLENFDTTRKI